MGVKNKSVMSSNSKKKNKKSGAVGDDYKVRDYSNEPYFIKKAEASKKVVEKYGLPKEWLKEKK